MGKKKGGEGGKRRKKIDKNTLYAKILEARPNAELRITII